MNISVGTQVGGLAQQPGAQIEDATVTDPGVAVKRERVEGG